MAAIVQHLMWIGIGCVAAILIYDYIMAPGLRRRMRQEALDALRAAGGGLALGLEAAALGLELLADLAEGGALLVQGAELLPEGLALVDGFE